MRVLVAGIGGIGGVLASRLNCSDLTLLTGNKEITDALRNQIVVDNYQYSLNATIVTTTDELSGIYDVVILVMKLNHLRSAVTELLPFFGETVVTFQNGLPEKEISDLLGDKLVGGVIGWGGTMIAPGRYKKTSPGSTYIGELDGKSTSRLNTLFEILKPIGNVVITENILGIKWSKLAINASINSVGVLTGETLGKNLSKQLGRKILGEIYAEVIEVAELEGIKLEPVASDPYLLYIPKNSGWLKWILKHFLIFMVGVKYRKVKSSSLQSLMRGRKTEAEFLNGKVVEIGRKHNYNAQANHEILNFIKRIEKGETSYNMKNLKLLAKSLNFR